MKPHRMIPLTALAAALACAGAAAQTPRGERDRVALDISSVQYSVNDLSGQAGAALTVRLAASLTQTLPRDWLVRASVNTQYSQGDLTLEQTLQQPSSTALNLMAHRDVLRDGGLGSNVELHSPNLCGALKCRALLFYDRNFIRYNRSLNGQLRSRNVGSAGVGMRLQLQRRMDVQLDYGRVVRSDVLPDDARNRLTLRFGYTW
jgi:hemolysin activation/secretion protein